MDHWTSVLADNVKRARLQNGLTLSGLSQRSGIAKSALSKLEAGGGNPTVETLWSISTALNIPFGGLLSSLENQISLAVHGRVEGDSTVCLLEQSTAFPRVETYMMELPSGYLRTAAPHAAGIKETVMVLQGDMLVGDASRPRRLLGGESYSFFADVEHVYGASEQPVKAVVCIEYPELGSGGQNVGQLVNWPDTAQAWEGFRSLAQQLALEVAQGMDGGLIRLRGAPESTESVVRRQLIEHSGLSDSDYSWPLYITAGRDSLGPFWVALPLWSTWAFAAHTLDNDENLLGTARRFAWLAETTVRWGVERSLPENPFPTSLALSCLCSEIALYSGQVQLPPVLEPVRPASTRNLSADAETSFSSRIDVDHYAAYELLHPAYARQVVALAEDIREFRSSSSTLQVVDIGTGPGTALLMLLELLPELRVLAVEPDDVAAHYLKIGAAAMNSIEVHHGGFLELVMQPASVPILTSIGASHHFNTAFMLQKAMLVLEPGGLLCVADEFLPEFHDLETRRRALILHHSAYLLWAMVGLDRSAVSSGDASGAFYDDIRQTICLAVIDAHCGFVTRAAHHCRKLLARLQCPAMERSGGSVLDAYVRFFRLELQAMVAGFDYEVECKTYARRFEHLARFCGFETVRHRRVFATTGAEEWQGGTHVFVFRKPVYPYKEDT